MFLDFKRVLFTLYFYTTDCKTDILGKTFWNHVNIGTEKNWTVMKFKNTDYKLISGWNDVDLQARLFTIFNPLK